MEQSKTYSIPGVRSQTYTPSAVDTHPKSKSKKSKKGSKVLVEDPAKKLSDLLNLNGLTPAQKAARITIWNRVEQRKIAGTAAPLRRNLAKYLHKNKQCDVFAGQDRIENRSVGNVDFRTGNIVSEVSRVTIWNPFKRIKITGNAAPLPKNLRTYFDRNPDMELYRGQDLILQHLDTASNSPNPGRSPSAMDIEASGPPLVRREHNPPGIHYPLLPDVSNFAGFEWEGNTKEKPPVHIFHETHELVPDSYWEENSEILSQDQAASSESTRSTDVTDASKSSTSSCPLPFEGGNPLIGTDEHDFTNLDRMGYEEMASSWSNTPMWTDPNCQFKLEPSRPFITPIHAERSLVFDDRPMDLTIEEQDFPFDIAAIRNTTHSSASFPGNHGQNSTQDTVDLSFTDLFFADTDDESAEK